MKNQHIKNLLEEVPVELRLEIYEEALDCIIYGIGVANCSPNSYPLCIILPVLLWDMKSMSDHTPDDERWMAFLTPNAFPELKEFVKGLDPIGMRTNPERIKFLEDTIKSLTK